ncbi:hypothetical protein [Streptomyces sp. NPDC047972]|uniref:hypothetical protein n=1 Tax=Streptomyces sp. NPDC047972 TaxID=3365493 RepID=UPI0037140A54
MTFILLTCGPMLAAALLVRWEPRAARHGRRAEAAARPAPRRTLVYCHVALSLPGSTA